MKLQALIIGALSVFALAGIADAQLRAQGEDPLMCTAASAA
jgi:hypothetical protein